MFEQWYQMPHASPDVLSEAVYGLVELHRKRIRHARVVANPGCYPVTVLLGLAPLFQDTPLIDAQHIIADCKSGVSWAGRKASLRTLFADSSDNFKAYGVVRNRQHPKISEQF